MIVARERAAIIGVDYFERVCLYIDVSFDSFEIDDNKLAVLIEHEVFRFYVSVEVAAIMYKLEYFEYIEEYGFGG